jgi:hypothetical protein
MPSESDEYVPNASKNKVQNEKSQNLLSEMKLNGNKSAMSLLQRTNWDQSRERRPKGKERN